MQNVKAVRRADPWTSHPDSSLTPTYGSRRINPYGTPAHVVAAIMSDRVIVVATRQLLNELVVVLARSKFRRWFSFADAVAFEETLGGKAELQPEPGPPPQRVRDPDYLVALAHEADAVIVTGDAALLEAELDPPAITPRALLEALS